DKNYGVAANVAYDVVPGLTVTAEVDYDHYGHFNDGTPFGNWTAADKKNSIGGLLRFQRSF
ncbi:MAG: porin, partial [Mesorhizobium sp.]